MNLGSVGGAGIAGHLHQHVVPRWGGDTNFMPVVGQTKVLPELLGPTRELLAAAWQEVTATAPAFASHAGRSACKRPTSPLSAPGRPGAPASARAAGSARVNVPVP